MISEALAVQGVVLMFPAIATWGVFSFETKHKAVGVVAGILSLLSMASFIASGWFAAAGA